MSQEFLEQPQLFIVDPSLPRTTPLPWPTGPIEDEEQLNIQCEKSTDMVEHGFLNSLVGGLIGFCADAVRIASQLEMDCTYFRG
jgi:hypothetical protein